MTTTHAKLIRCSSRNRCMKCGRTDWCSNFADGSHCICMRISDGAVRQTRNGGYLHRTNGIAPVIDRRPAPVCRHDLPLLARNYLSAVNPARLTRLADKLGLTVESLRRLGIGWSHDHGAWSFPMQDASDRIVGIRLRSDSGRKWSVTGGHEGLFVPDGLVAGGTLLVTEGPSDCAAMLDLGFQCIGRPSCAGGTRHVIDLVLRLRPLEVVIVADADAPGQRGAEAMATTLVAYVPRVRVVFPPTGTKDARMWKNSGATAADVQVAIATARARTIPPRGRVIGMIGTGAT